MLDNLNCKFETMGWRHDVNDDEVEVDLLEIFHTQKKILPVLMVALPGVTCMGCIYTVLVWLPI